MRILVTGSRSWYRVQTVWEALSAKASMKVFYGRHEPMTIVHGKCEKSPDEYASQWAKAARPAYPFDVIDEPHPAQWRLPDGTYIPTAGFDRNSLMVRLGATECLAFIARCNSLKCRITEPHGSHGATDTADKAEAAGIPTLRYYEP